MTARMAEREALAPADSIAEFLARSPKTLANWRWRGYGPPYYKLPGGVFYRLSEVREWLDRQRVEPSAS